MPEPNQITPAQLMRLIGLPDAPAIVDVRLPEDLAADPRLIPGSFTLPHDRFDPPPARLLRSTGDRGLPKGAQTVRRGGGPAARPRPGREVLEGGSMAWAEAALPMIPIAAFPQTNLWVTRHRPKIDRIACPWLIRRFVDPTARFLFVAPTEVQSVADRFNATPFDIEGCFYSHRGDSCTFDTLITELALQTEALDRLAHVVRAADTDRHDLSPQAAGLLAISVGPVAAIPRRSGTTGRRHDPV